MADTISSTFRTPSAPVESAKPTVLTDAKVGQSANIEVPYLDFESEHAKPFTVNYYNLGDRWRDEVGGFSKEVGTIETYFKEKVESGDMPNSIEAVTEALKKMEKFINVPKEERVVMKLETLSHYIEFLNKCDKTKFNLKHYANVK